MVAHVLFNNEVKLLEAILEMLWLITEMPEEVVLKACSFYYVPILIFSELLRK